MLNYIFLQKQHFNWSIQSKKIKTWIFFKIKRRIKNEYRKVQLNFYFFKRSSWKQLLEQCNWQIFIVGKRSGSNRGSYTPWQANYDLKMAEKLTKNKPFWMQWRPDKRKTGRPFSLHRGTSVALFNSHFSSWNSDKSDVFRWPLSFGRGDEEKEKGRIFQFVSMRNLHMLSNFIPCKNVSLMQDKWKRRENS